ncbi:hypothetical protein MKW92_046574 [Papaver armeniacum]|nr:hypothetical protein MKW92_046574 [Papaver armeniacum]
MNSSPQIFNHFFFFLSLRKSFKKVELEADICCWPFLLVLLQRKLQKVKLSSLFANSSLWFTSECIC